MARPRVFISSTFYDLRQVRADLDRFISEMGYDAVSNERGDIPYGSQQALENYCYKEIGNCDILISIVGGRFGTESRHSENSISQMEVQNAVELGKQLYVFVEADVLAELKTYRLNKETAGIKYAYADDIRIFQFLEKLDSLGANNTRFSFHESSDIINILREQWAGLFQRLLQTQARQEEVRMIRALQATAQSLDELVKYNTQQAKAGDEIVNEILLPSHPIFSHLGKLLSVSYRVYFQNFTEMKHWLTVRGYREQKNDDESFYSFVNIEIKQKRPGEGRIISNLFIRKDLFSLSGNLKVMSEANWNNDFIKLHEKIETAPPPSIDMDDEIPF